MGAFQVELQKLQVIALILTHLEHTGTSIISLSFETSFYCLDTRRGHDKDPEKERTPLRYAAKPERCLWGHLDGEQEEWGNTPSSSNLSPLEIKAFIFQPHCGGAGP